MNVNITYLIAGANFVILLGMSLVFFDYLKSRDASQFVDTPPPSLETVVEEPVMVSLDSDPETK